VPLVPLNATTRLFTELPGPVTLPEPLGDAHVPSPRQKVELEALVPLFKRVTGRLPVVPPLIGSPPQFVSVPLFGVPSAGVTSVRFVTTVTVPPSEISVDPKVNLKSDVKAYLLINGGTSPVGSAKGIRDVAKSVVTCARPLIFVSANLSLRNQIT
jgi:hypothetical protein